MIINIRGNIQEETGCIIITRRVPDIEETYPEMREDTEILKGITGIIRTTHHSSIRDIMSPGTDNMMTEGSTGVTERIDTRGSIEMDTENKHRWMESLTLPGITSKDSCRIDIQGIINMPNNYLFIMLCYVRHL